MSRLAPALRLRRRELDGLRLAIAAEQRCLQEAAAAAAALHSRRTDERRRAGTLACGSDEWFALAALRLQALAEQEQQAGQRLAALRAATLDARARLSLLEQADADARQTAVRLRERKVQDRLDDRTAADWVRR